MMAGSDEYFTPAITGAQRPRARLKVGEFLMKASSKISVTSRSLITRNRWLKPKNRFHGDVTQVPSRFGVRWVSG